MKTALIIIVFIAIGIVIGFGLHIALVLETEQTTIITQSQSTDILDMLINEWTQRKFNTSEAVIVKHSNEIKNAKGGYFPDTVKAIAQQVYRRYKVPAGVVLAQYALESGWGLNELGASNYFGHTYAAVKRYMPYPAYVERIERTAKPGDPHYGKLIKFARYRNFVECFNTHGKYLSTSALYKKAFRQKNAENFARQLGTHYATDPDYAIKLIAIMRRYHLNNL